MKGCLKCSFCPGSLMDIWCLPGSFSLRAKCVQRFPVTGTSVSKAGRLSLDAFWGRTSVRYGLGCRALRFCNVNTKGLA